MFFIRRRGFGPLECLGLLLALTPGCGSGGSNLGGDASTEGALPDLSIGDQGMCQPGPVTTATVNPSPPGASTTPATLFDGRCGAAVGQLFPPSAPWNQSVRETCVDPRSNTIIQYLAAVVDGSQTFRIDLGDSDNDYGFQPLAADASTRSAVVNSPSQFQSPSAQPEFLTTASSYCPA